MAGKVIGKFIRILSKRIHKNFMTSPISYDNRTPEGMFRSFYSIMDGGKRSVRFNFLLKNSDILHSVDIFHGPSRTPDVKVYLEGLNAIQILKTVEDALRGIIEPMTEKVQGKFKEAKPIDPTLKQWADTVDAYSMVQTAKMRDLELSYVAWCNENGFNPGNNVYQKVRNFMKGFLQANPSVAPRNLSIGSVTTSIPRDRQLVTTDAVQAYSEIENDIDDHLKKYDQMKLYLNIMVHGSDADRRGVNALYIAGKAGMGKSSSLVPYLEASGKRFKVYKGRISAPTLIEVLWRHSSYDPMDIIVFDDCDSVISGTDTINIMKSVMEMGPKRIITNPKVSNIHDENYFREEDEEVGTPVEFADFGMAQNTEVELPRTKAPSEFELLPRIILISNKEQVDKAIMSRCLVVKFNFTEDQVWDLIEANIENILDPQNRVSSWENIQGINFRSITPDVAREITRFCRSLKAGLEVADFRQINFAYAIYMATEGDEWKRWCRMHYRRI